MSDRIKFGLTEVIWSPITNELLLAKDYFFDVQLLIYLTLSKIFSFHHDCFRNFQNENSTRIISLSLSSLYQQKQTTFTLHPEIFYLAMTTKVTSFYLTMKLNNCYNFHMKVIRAMFIQRQMPTDWIQCLYIKSTQQVLMN